MKLDVIVQEYEVPFGLVMLGVVMVFAVLFLVSVGEIKTSALKRKLQASREVQKEHKVLTETDSHRISKLENMVRERLDSIEAKVEGVASQLRQQDVRLH